MFRHSSLHMQCMGCCLNHASLTHAMDCMHKVLHNESQPYMSTLLVITLSAFVSLTLYCNGWLQNAKGASGGHSKVSGSGGSESCSSSAQSPATQGSDCSCCSHHLMSTSCQGDLQPKARRQELMLLFIPGQTPALVKVLQKHQAQLAGLRAGQKFYCVGNDLSAGCHHVPLPEALAWVPQWLSL